MNVELLVEGYTDELFVKRCFELLGISVGTVYGKRGAAYVVEKAAGFAVRGRFSPILILADLMDMAEDCPGLARVSLVPQPEHFTLTRFAVPEIESWLIASRAEVARYFGISEGQVPCAPDTLDDPKRTLVNLARQSPRGRLRRMFVPKQGSSAVIGAGYVDGFAQFLASHWEIDSAKAGSPSFAKFVERVVECFKPASAGSSPPQNNNP